MHTNRSMHRGWRWTSTMTLATSLESLESRSPTQPNNPEFTRLLDELRSLIPGEVVRSSDPLTSCLLALRLLEEDLLNLVRGAAERVVDSVDALAAARIIDVADITTVAGAVKEFVAIVAERYPDCRFQSTKEEIQIRVELIKTFLPFLLPSSGSGAGPTLAASFILNQLKSNVVGLLTTIETNLEGDSNIGGFLDLMDRALEDLATGPDLVNIVQDIVKHALNVSKICGREDEEEILLVGRSLADKLERLKTEKDERSERILEDDIKDLLHHTEEKINTGLLRLFCRTLGSQDNPLESLLLEVLNVEIDTHLRTVQDLELHIQRLDNQTDAILSLCEFCLGSTRNLVDASVLRHSARTIQTLESDLVPAILQLYLRPEVAEYRGLVRVLRQVWRRAQERLFKALNRIVDPAAFSVIILAETKRIAKQIIDRLYEQSGEELKREVLLLVGMCETGVDLAWQETDRASSPLPETHPLVRTERSVWEVRAAARILVASLQDLQLHRALVKRTKVLINNFSDLSTFLIEQGQENEAVNSVQGSPNILPQTNEAAYSVHGSPHVLSRTNEAINADHGSPNFLSRTNNNWTKMSFHSIRNPEKSRILTKSLRRDMYRLTVDMTPYLPGTPEARTRNPLRLQGTPESSVRLSSVLDQLSLLSHQLSLNLEQGVKSQNVEGVQDQQTFSDRNADYEIIEHRTNVNIGESNSENFEHKLSLTIEEYNQKLEIKEDTTYVEKVENKPEIIETQHKLKPNLESTEPKLNVESINIHSNMNVETKSLAKNDKSNVENLDPKTKDFEKKLNGLNKNSVYSTETDNPRPNVSLRRQIFKTLM